MRQLRLPAALLLAALSTLPLSAQQARRSPHETTSQRLAEGHGPTLVTLIYGRPYTKDPKTGEPRKIWGGLVPWNESYRLGADEATTLITQQAITIGTANVPAGTYTLYAVPSEKGATLLGISTRVGQWGEPVDDTHDLARVEMKREALDTPVDQLTIVLDKDPAGGAVLRVKWENTMFSVPVKLANAALEFPQASTTETLKQRIGLTDIEVVYSRPSARGRVMLGGNNPFGTVWRTGANSATRISFSTPVTIEGSPLDAGAYELFSIPGADSWTIIFQKPQKQWGAYTYDAKNDALRVTVKPTSLAEHVETFTIDFNDILNESATLNLIWEKTLVPVKVGVDLVSLLQPKIEAAMAGPEPRPYASAAIFYGDHGIDLDKAAAWIGAAVAAHPDVYYFTYHQALILAKKGDKEGAIAAARKSEDSAKADSNTSAREEYIRLNEALIASLK
jgi:Protein of unknown function (DUF2911)